jgi:hypothetical protein
MIVPQLRICKHLLYMELTYSNICLTLPDTSGIEKMRPKIEHFLTAENDSKQVVYFGPP